MKLKTICFLIIAISFILNTRAFSLQYRFQPRVSATQKYTSNVFLSEDDEKDDFISIASIGFTATALGKTGALEVSYDPAYTKYADFDENDAWRHDAKLRGWSNLGKRTRFDVWNRFLQTEDPLEEEDILALRDNDITQEGDTTVRKGRRTFYRNTATTRLSHQFGKDDSIYAGFVYGLLRNDNPQEEDNDRYSPSVGLNYWFGPKFGLESNAYYTRGEFDRDSNFVGDPTDDFNNYAGSLRFIRRTKTRFSAFVQYNQIYRDFDGDVGDSNDYLVYAPSAGFIYRVQKDLNLRLGGGYFYLQIDDDNDEQGIFLNSQIDKIWKFERGKITLTGLTGVDQNNFGAQNIGFEQYGAVQGSALYKLARTVNWDINAKYRYSDVIGSTEQDDDDDTGSNVHRLRADTGITILPLKWMEIKLSYSFNKLISDEETDEYEEHRGFLKVTLTPDKPYRTK
jgi:hypothetical protein